MNYEPILNQLIIAIVHPLKSGLELELSLKAKLTKKELKLLKFLAKETNKNKIKEQLSFSDDEYKRVESNLIKKLNQEKIKQVLYNI